MMIYYTIGSYAHAGIHMDQYLSKHAIIWVDRCMDYRLLDTVHDEHMMLTITAILIHTVVGDVITAMHASHTSVSTGTAELAV